MSGKDATAHQWWADPLNPHVWAISDDSGTWYATIGTRVPAWGQLAEVTIGHGSPGHQAAMASTLVKPSGHQGMSVHSTAARSNQAHRPLDRTVLDRSATQTRG